MENYLYFQSPLKNEEQTNLKNDYELTESQILHRLEFSQRQQHKKCSHSQFAGPSCL